MSKIESVTAAVQAGHTTVSEVAAYLKADRTLVRQALNNAVHHKRLSKLTFGAGGKRLGCNDKVAAHAVYAPIPRQEAVVPTRANVIPLNRRLPVTSVFDLGQRAANEGEWDDWLRAAL